MNVNPKERKSNSSPKSPTKKEIPGQFEYNTKNSNPHAFDVHRPSIEGATLLG